MNEHHAVVVRNVHGDNTSLMALCTVLTAFAEPSTLVYVDGSEQGVTERVNDALNAYRALGWAVIVARPTRTRHGDMMSTGLGLCHALGARVAFHFDDDVVVLPGWDKLFDGVLDERKVHTRKVLESQSTKGYRETPSGEHRLAGLPGFMVFLSAITQDVIDRIGAHDGGPLEDIRLGSALSGVVVHPSVGVVHSTRVDGGKYLGTALRMLVENLR